MDDTACERYFLEPAGRRQRQYEALRAVFVEHRRMADVADHYGYHYGYFRNLVSRFRRQVVNGSPPFSMETP